MLKIWTLLLWAKNDKSKVQTAKPIKPTRNDQTCCAICFSYDASYSGYFDETFYAEFIKTPIKWKKNEDCHPQKYCKNVKFQKTDGFFLGAYDI